MAQKRFRATSVLDERGDLWVMGGSRGDSTIQADDKWVHLFDSDGNDKVWSLVPHKARGFFHLALSFLKKMTYVAMFAVNLC